MLNQILDLVKQNGLDAIVKNPAIPNENNEAALQDASSSIVEVIKSQISGGNLQQLLAVFQSGQLSGVMDNPVVKQIVDQFSAKLQNNYGVNADSAQESAQQLIPQVLEKFTGKLNDPNDNAFSMDNILNVLKGDDGKFGLDDLKGFASKFGF